MKRVSSGERLMIYLDKNAHRGGTLVYVEIVDRARKAGLAGATVIKGVEGFGASSRVHRQRPLSVALDVPVVVMVVDSPARIDAFVASLDDLHLGAVMVRQPVEMIAYRRDATRGRRDR